jgi:valyl-tRNA synthetase
MSGEDAPTAAATAEVGTTLEEYAALSAADRLALPLTQSRRKKLDKLLAAHLKKAEKAAAAAALGKNSAATAVTAEKPKKAPAKAKPAADVNPDLYRRPETVPGEHKRLADVMAPTYTPQDVEACWYEWWDAQGYFKVKAADAAGKSRDEKFVMVIPPPNVTGSLHLGHALMCSVQDAMTRWHRMHGRTALYLPGVDHAGIATQVVVESQLRRLGRPDRHAMGREKFVAEVWKWKEEYGSKIMQQMKRIGSSLDWDREEFTMSDRLSAAVKEAFVRFYDDGLIYRDTRLVNWSCHLRTAISDIEVDKVDIPGPTMRSVPGHTDQVEFGVLTHFAYKIRRRKDEEDTDVGELVVATTRLETMLGDTAVAVHPDDPRYKHLIGRNLRHPFAERDVPIIGDAELVDMEFGTGAVKVTPAHDPNDFACGRRHGLPEITVLTETGIINELGGERFAGMMRYVARVEIEKALDKLGLLRGKKPNAMVLGICQRSGDVVEPLLKPQWWVNCKDLAKRSSDAVRDGELHIIPDNYADTWYRWLDDIHDWCVSRQLWWGHRIPAYKVTSPSTGGEEVWVVGRSDEEARERAAKKLGIEDVNSITVVQDEDVLDTWFSSGLFPFSVFGWPNETEDMTAFFPTSVLETGYDILFFWVARMVMMSIGLTGKLPFHTVCLHTMVRDKRGRKMSKSLGNVIDPLYVIDGASLKVLIDKIRDSNLGPSEVAKAIADKESEFPEGIPACGADSLRMGLLAYMSQTGDINLDVARVIGYRNFGNKLWNATRFAITNLGSDFEFTTDGLAKARKLGNIADRWILSRLNAAIVATNEAYEAFRLGDAVQALYSFWMNELCAIYLENMKPIMRGNDEDSKSAARHILYECLYSELRLLHPMMPFVTEELYHRLPGPKPFASIVIAAFPDAVPSWTDRHAEQIMNAMKRVIQIARSTGVEFGLKPSARPEVYVVAASSEAARELQPEYVKTLTPCGHVTVLIAGDGQAPPPGCAAKVVDDLYEVHMVLSGLVDFQAEIAKLDASALEKRRVIKDYENKMASEGYEARVPENIRARNLELKEKRERYLSAISALTERFRALLERQDLESK